MPNWDQEKEARFGQRQTSGALTIITPKGIECSGCGKPITGHRCLSAYFINITTSSSINVRYTEKDLGQNAKFELFSYLKDLKALR